MGHGLCQTFIESCPQGVLQTERVVIQPESSGCVFCSSHNRGYEHRSSLQSIIRPVDLSMSSLCTLEDHKGTKDLMLTSVNVSGWLSSLYCWQRLLAW